MKMDFSFVLFVFCIFSAASGLEPLLKGFSDSHSPPQDLHILPHVSTLDSLSKNHSHHLFLQLKSNHSESTKLRMRTLFSDPLDKYIPYHTYIVYARVEKALDALGDEDVENVIPVMNVHKLSRDMSAKTGESGDGELLVATRDSATDIALIEKTLEACVSDGAGSFSTRILTSDRVKVLLTGESAEVFQQCADLLSELPESLYVEPVVEMTLLNKWARSILQSGDGSGKHAGNVLWERGLRGEGEIIGVGDSGLDVKSCFFSDPDENVPFVQWGRSGPPNTSPSAHRKIAQYVTFGDSLDSDGHGTHVAGSVAGQYQGSNLGNSEFDGGAPDAKIAFFDLGTSDGSSDQISIPAVLGSEYFNWAYSLGARVHSNSWGSDQFFYSGTSASVDSFIYNNPDFSVVFSAGNLGARGEGTVMSPASAKNCIAVGASVSSRDMFEDVFCRGGIEEQSSLCSLGTGRFAENYNENDIAAFSSMGPTFDGRIKPDIVAPGLSVLSAKNGQSGQCSASATNVLTAKMGTSMSAPTVAGGVALIRQYFLEGYYPGGEFRGRAHGFSPSAALVKAMVINSGVELTGKMDIGTVDNNGNLGFANVFRSVGTAPNNIQGFGRAQLDTALRFQEDNHFALLIAGYSEKSAVQEFEDGVNYADSVIEGSGYFHKYRICVHEADVPLTKITMVYTDYPAQPQALIALVNDLDLIVELKGENFTETTKTIYGNEGSGPDRRNNVEQVVLREAKRGEIYDITVLGTSVPVKNQAYALVITGKVSPSDSTGACNFTGMPFNPIEKDRDPDARDSSGLETLFAWLVENWFLFILVAVFFGIVVYLCLRRSCSARGAARPVQGVPVNAPAVAPSAPVDSLDAPPKYPAGDAFWLPGGWRLMFNEGMRAQRMYY